MTQSEVSSGDGYRLINGPIYMNFNTGGVEKVTLRCQAMRSCDIKALYFLSYELFCVI